MVVLISYPILHNVEVLMFDRYGYTEYNFWIRQYQTLEFSVVMHYFITRTWSLMRNLFVSQIVDEPIWKTCLTSMKILVCWYPIRFMYLIFKHDLDFKKAYYA